MFPLDAHLMLFGSKDLLVPDVKIRHKEWNLIGVVINVESVRSTKVVRIKWENGNHSIFEFQHWNVLEIIGKKLSKGVM